MNSREFAAEYADMRAQGMSHEEIARAFHVQPASLMRRIFRNNVPYLPESEERPIYEALEKFIASGREFTSAELPQLGCTPQHRMTALMRAHHRRRIEVVGSSERGNIYRAVAQKDSVAA